jgi:AmmeMemoRadiSam system protein A
MKKSLKLTELARKTLEAELNKEKFLVNEETKKKYSKKQASFVTLTEKSTGDLRGCIGSLIPRQELWKDVQENAINAAFSDFRFSPLEKQELKKIKIEISVLSIPKPLKCKDEKELLNKLNHNLGVILKSNGRTSTFLPQVWEQLPDKISFLEHLSQKAGLNKDAWKKANFEIYEVEKEEEN